MKYMALIYADENAWETFSDTDREAAYAQYRAFADEARDAGALAGGDELGSTRNATTVRVRDGETLVTDGPYAEVKEALGGYFVLDCATPGGGRRARREYPGRASRIGRGPTGLRRSRGGTAVKYAMLIYGDDSEWIHLPDEEKAVLRAEEIPHWETLFGELAKADPNVAGYELNSRKTAQVVQVRDGDRLVTDGPFAETKEILGGVFLVDLPDLDEAIRLASLIPAAKNGSIEIRPIVE